MAQFRGDYGGGDDDSAGFDVIEEIAPTRLLAITGRAMTSISPARLTGALDGTVHFLDRSSFSTRDSCASRNHQIVFSR